MCSRGGWAVLSVEIRCPVGPRRLFGIYRQSGARPVVTTENLIEFSCADCRRSLRSEGQSVSLVLHRYSLTGALVESEVVPDTTDSRKGPEGPLR